MIKKMMASAAVAASVVGIGAAMAPQAMAIGNDNGVNTVNGNDAAQIYGNQATYGNMSPQMALIQGSFNKPCIALPAKANVQSVLALRQRRRPGHPGPVQPAEPAVHRELHAGQGRRGPLAHPRQHPGPVRQRLQRQLTEARAGEAVAPSGRGGLAASETRPPRRRR